MAGGDGDLTPFAYQVAGHFTPDDLPTMLQTSDGHLLKPLAADERGSRELLFYQCAESARARLSGTSNHKLNSVSLATGDQPLTSSIMRVDGRYPLAVEQLTGIVSHIPRCYGVRHITTGDAIMLENLCQGYTRPFICDMKLGYRTTYCWASEEYNRKNCAMVVTFLYAPSTPCLKDTQSTQGSLGFKISGMCTWKAGEKMLFDKPQCAEASRNMISFLESFVNRDNGIANKDVWQPVIQFVDQLSEWVTKQSGPAWHLISVSLLIVYEGTATHAESLRMRCALVDFPHTFFVDHGPDDNMLQGLVSLRNMLEAACGQASTDYD